MRVIARYFLVALLSAAGAYAHAYDGGPVIDWRGHSVRGEMSRRDDYVDQRRDQRERMRQLRQDLRREMGRDREQDVVVERRGWREERRETIVERNDRRRMSADERLRLREDVREVWRERRNHRYDDD